MDVNVSTFVTFVFDEEMAPVHAIAWSDNVDPTRLQYSWLPGNSALMVNLPGGFPGDATISWELNPTAGGPNNFRDIGGNPLPSGTFSGSFTTAAGGGDPTDPCDDPTDPSDGSGFGSVAKYLDYVQVGNNAPVPDPESEPMFMASFQSPETQTTSSVTITGPGGLDATLDSFFNSFFYSESFATAAELEAAYPAGQYTLTVNGSAGTESVVLNLGSSTALPAPQVLNLTALATMDVSSDFTLNFAGLPNPGEFDSISIHFSDDSGTVFSAPDPCRGIELPNTATSIVIPAGTFEEGVTYDGSITFSRGELILEAFTDASAMSMITAGTSFQFTLGGGGNPEPTAPMFLTPVLNPDGSIEFGVATDSGATVVIESTSDFLVWNPVTTETALDGSVTVTITPETTGSLFFRASVQ